MVTQRKLMSTFSLKGPQDATDLRANAAKDAGQILPANFHIDFQERCKLIDPS